mmetsp:Transcript_42927/g.134710  ORF Transcript_42927/g.134710 Transcript_42927/m.134710 type:complete len:268 (-) Transcript_42927:134-937(-)
MRCSSGSSARTACSLMWPTFFFASSTRRFSSARCQLTWAASNSPRSRRRDASSSAGLSSMAFSMPARSFCTFASSSGLLASSASFMRAHLAIASRCFSRSCSSFRRCASRSESPLALGAALRRLDVELELVHGALLLAELRLHGRHLLPQALHLLRVHGAAAAASTEARGVVALRRRPRERRVHAQRRRRCAVAVVAPGLPDVGSAAVRRRRQRRALVGVGFALLGSWLLCVAGVPPPPPPPPLPSCSSRRLSRSWSLHDMGARGLG